MASKEKNQQNQDYKPNEIESRWQQAWNKNKIYSPNLDTAKKPFYTLMMFPYPSAEGMHVGNMYAFTGADVYGRFMRMQGFDVFEPIGLDGFGIHSENYAIKIGRHPKEQSKISEANFYRQLRATGNGFDWSRKVETYDPSYYKWTQWLFIQLFKAGLAYRKKAPVNFCPSCKTVLADEQVINKIKNHPPASEFAPPANDWQCRAGRRRSRAGKSKIKNTTQKSKVDEAVAVCERCETEVIKKDLEQWFFRITKYADRLLENIKNLDWTEKVKIAQRQWIGRSEGAQIEFKIHPSAGSGSKFKIEVFTTRADTLYGATFLVLSPENPIVSVILNSSALGGQVRDDIAEYVKSVKKKNERERIVEGREKTGVFTGLYAINPVNNEKIPVWIADYVLMGYGTGAIMAVPAHDQRDFEFAKKYKLKIRYVVVPTKKSAFADGLVSQTDLLNDRIDNLRKNITEKDGFVKGVDLPGVEPGRPGLSIRSSKPAKPTPESAYTNYGILVNSGKYTGLSSQEAMERITNDLNKRGLGTEEVTYHLRDWLISRQRYWGPPIPMIYCQACARKGKSWFASTKKSSDKEDYLVNLKADSLNGWIDTLKGNIAQRNDFVKIQNKGVDSPRVEPGRLGVSIQPSQPAEPTPESVYRKNNEFVNDWDSVGWFPVPEKDLPVLLPNVKDWKPKGTGKSPLATVESFVNTKCPNCKGPAKRETDVSDTFLDSAWYFLRYVSTDIESTAFDIERVKKWLPVKMYIGGAEHSVLHLLYSRFVTMALHDLGFIDFDEPFTRFYANGLLIKEGAKMSKSRGNVVVPDDYIKKFGADTLRLYLMFIGPYSQGGDFYDTGIEGMHKFLKRAWILICHSELDSESQSGKKNEMPKQVRHDISRLRMMHKTIKKVTEDISSLKYNTAIAALMEWQNFLKSKISAKGGSASGRKNQKSKITKEEVEVFLKLLAPFAPHIAEELWQKFFVARGPVRSFPPANARSSLSGKAGSNELRVGGNPSTSATPQSSSIHLQPWLKYDPKFLEEDEVTIVVQVNGRVRDIITVQSSNLKVKSYVEEIARKSDKVKKHLKGKPVKKVVYVEGKVINFVTE